MPCDQIILCKIEISAANGDLLTLALETLIEQGILPRYRLGGERAREQAARIIRQGLVRLPAGQEFLVDRIKQEYSRQAVQAAARKFGWRVYQKSPQKLTVTRSL